MRTEGKVLDACKQTEFDTASHPLKCPRQVVALLQTQEREPARKESQAALRYPTQSAVSTTRQSGTAEANDARPVSGSKQRMQPATTAPGGRTRKKGSLAQRQWVHNRRKMEGKETPGRTSSPAHSPVFTVAKGHLRFQKTRWRRRDQSKTCQWQAK